MGIAEALDDALRIDGVDCGWSVTQKVSGASLKFCSMFML